MISLMNLTVDMINEGFSYVEVIIRAGFTNRLCRLKPRASRSKGTSSKLCYAWGQLLVCDQIDKYSL